MFLESCRNQGGLVGVVPKADDKLLEAVQEEAGATVLLKRLRSLHRLYRGLDFPKIIWQSL